MQPSITLAPATKRDEIKELAQLAFHIWHEYWPPIIGSAQTTYMVDLFQTPEAITADINKHGYRYWFVIDEEGKKVGYTAAVIEDASGVDGAAFSHSGKIEGLYDRRLFISKIYLAQEARGKHYASRIIAFYEDWCREEGLPCMYLTVNRENTLGIRAYTGRGFEIFDEVDNDIGSGFTMTDYIMCKIIESS